MTSRRRDRSPRGEAEKVRAGFERHLVKPIAVGELSRVVSELVP